MTKSHSRTIRASRILACGVCFALGCDAVEAPLPVRNLDLELASLLENRPLQSSVDAGSGVLRVSAVPVDSSITLAANDRVDVAVTTTTGDEEILQFAPMFCDGWRSCREISVVMEPFHWAHELARAVASVPARMPYGFGAISAEVVVFDPARTPLALFVLRRSGIVKSADMVAYGFAGNAPSRSRLQLAAPVDVGAATRNNGVVEVARGDSIVVLRHQPGGSTLRLAIAVR